MSSTPYIYVIEDEESISKLITSIIIIIIVVIFNTLFKIYIHICIPP